MSTYARVEGNKVAEILTVNADQNIADLFHPDFVATCHECGSTVEVGYTWDGSAFNAPLAPPVDLVAYAAAKRLSIETGGIMVNGAMVDTSRDSQSMITGAYNYAKENPSKTINFKAASGWIAITADQAIAIGSAVGDHVQACFTAECDVDTAITSGAITTPTEIDAFNWPINT